MEYTTLGRTGLRVSVAGFGCGGASRLGQGTGSSEAESVALVRRAIDLGVNFFDTAAAYGTEGIVGTAIKGIPRESVVLSTKGHIRRQGKLLNGADVVAGLEASLRRLGTDYVDVYHLHGVPPDDYDHVLAEIVPALLAQKAKGTLRHLGITETAVRDPQHLMLRRALADGPWEVVMLAFHMLNQNARDTVFPLTLERGVGTLLMFVVRRIFSDPAYRAQIIDELAQAGRLQIDENGGDPLAFLMHEGGADGLIDAAYRYARHEPGADVILFGTGKPEHLKRNVESILKPPLPEADRAELAHRFGHLEGVGLDAPWR